MDFTDKLAIWISVLTLVLVGGAAMLVHSIPAQAQKSGGIHATCYAFNGSMGPILDEDFSDLKSGTTAVKFIKSDGKEVAVVLGTCVIREK